MLKKLPCPWIPDTDAFMIVETDASEIGYGGLLKQKLFSSLKEQIVKYDLGIWSKSQKKHSVIKKEILLIVLCITKSQDDLFSKIFLLQTDCKVAKLVLEKDVKNLVSKHIFAR